MLMVQAARSRCMKHELVKVFMRTKSHGKVPGSPTWRQITEADLPPQQSIDESLVEHLQRLALVDFSNQEAIDRLNKAIRFADHLSLVHTSGVQPMDSVLEDRSLYLREDKVTAGGHREQLLKNAAKSVEDYFVAPPGNIPVDKAKIS